MSLIKVSGSIRPVHGAEKIAIDIYPLGEMMKNGLKSLLNDTTNCVLLVSIESDLDSYPVSKPFSARVETLEAYFMTGLDEIEAVTDSMRAEFKEKLNIIKKCNYTLRRSYGSWIRNPSKSKSAQLWTEIGPEGIKFSVMVKHEKETKEEILCSFAPYLVTTLYETGKVAFLDDQTIQYTPKSYFEPVSIKV